MSQRVIRNARIVTATDTFTGCAVIEDGKFKVIDWGGAMSSGAEDWEGAWLLPGLVEVHTDNLEKHLVPGPGVIWNATSATVTHDAQCAAAGITTVLDPIVIGDMDQGGTRSQTYQTSIDALHVCRREGLMRVDGHYRHGAYGVRAKPRATATRSKSFFMAISLAQLQSLVAAGEGLLRIGRHHRHGTSFYHGDARIDGAEVDADELAHHHDPSVLSHFSPDGILPLGLG